MKAAIAGLVFAVFLLSAVSISANGDHQAVAEEGKALVESEIDCSELSEEQLGTMGEYFMEQMHPGEQHEAIHEMMGIEEGTEYHKQFHANIAGMMYCGQGSMMGMMPMMMGGGNMMGSGGMMNAMGGNVIGAQNPQSSMMQGMMGSWGYGYFSLLNALYVILLVGLVILVYLGIIRLWRMPGKKRRMW